MAAPREFVAQEDNFRCLQSGAKPDGKTFFVFHKKKARLKKALRVAARDLPHKRYPVGTIIQLFPFEAMVKRGGRFNREGNGWEFFKLGVSAEGTTILARGGAEVINFLGTSCQNCHAPAKDFDFICEGHDAVPQLGVSADIIRALQVDPRCGTEP